MNCGERVFVNTLALYVRMVVSVVLALLSARYILAVLGADDYGLFGVVAGIMGFLGFLNSAMASGSQRHFSYELGKGDARQFGRVFSASLGIHLAMVVLLVVLGETIGLWFLEHVLNIPEARRVAAAWVYQCTILTVVANLIAVPFQALLTAHEAFLAVSLLGIAQSLLFFLLALSLGHLPGDHLITYAIFICAINFVVMATQVVMALLRYPESRLGLRALPEWRVMVQIVSFSAWNLFGALSIVTRLQGIAFLLNIYFGTAINAAYSIANQVGAQTSQLAQSMLQAISPQVTKSEGAGNRERSLSLGLLTNKYAFLIDCFWLFPLYAELPTILHIWLKDVPPYTTEFCRMVLLLLAIEKLSAGFMTTVSAIGKIAMYQTVVCGTLICILPAGWIAFKLGYSPLSVFRIAIVFFAVATILRVWFVRCLTGMPYARWVRDVLLRVIYAILPAVMLAYVLCAVMHAGFPRFLVLALAVCPAMLMGTVFLGMDSSERCRWHSLAKSLLSSPNGSHSILFGGKKPGSS